MTTCALTTLHGIDALCAHEPALTDLWRRSNATAFQHPGWWIPWCDAFGAQHLEVALASSGSGVPSGALALYRSQDDDVLRGVGCSVSDYLDAVIDRSTPDETIRLAEWLDGRGEPIDLPDLPSAGGMLRVLARCTRPVELSACATCCVIALPGSVPEWRASLAHGLARNLERYDRKLRDAGETRYETAARADVAEFVDAFVTLHSARWQSRGEPGVLADAAVERFHRAAIPRLVDAGVAHLHGIRHRGRLIAVQYVLRAHGEAWSYLSGFDPAAARFSPGTLLMAYSIESAIEAGCTSFDLLRGDEPYKAVWATGTVTTSRAWLPAVR